MVVGKEEGRRGKGGNGGKWGRRGSEKEEGRGKGGEGGEACIITIYMTWRVIIAGLVSRPAL